MSALMRAEEGESVSVSGRQGTTVVAERPSARSCTRNTSVAIVKYIVKLNNCGSVRSSCSSKSDTAFGSTARIGMVRVVSES